MNFKRVVSLLIVLHCGLFHAPADGNDTQKGDSSSNQSTSIQSATGQAHTESANQANQEFKLPKRGQQKEKSASGFSLKQTLGDTGLKLAIVIGILMIFVILLAKRKDSQSIPKEAIEVLGRIPFSTKQSIQLIKFGQKLVLVEASASGLKPISEITDPAEVEQMVQMIRPSSN